MNKFVAIAAALGAAGLLGTAAIAAEDHSSHGAPPASGQDSGPSAGGHGHGMKMMMKMGGHGQAAPAGSATPALPGQDAFGAIQEVIRILEADPKTDWSKVNLAGLREHLIDMNDVTLKSTVAERPIEGGLEATVTGEGRTRAAIKRMLTAHAREIDGRQGWKVRAEEIAEGVRLTATATDAKEIAHIRGLGFIGLLASGSHHQPHHLAMARGEFAHDGAAHGAHGSHDTKGAAR